ncbi:hypothetical protein [Paenibacillus jiagnxiensis]|uniref:hypothetical protein n=1 Tax=Paenibacillus jiagnxiensis TaxID=3228926 RepID=UPI0033A8F825
MIEQAQAEYETIREQVAEHYQQARELRNQADKLTIRTKKYTDNDKSPSFT